MRLTDEERAVLDGRDGRAQQKAMELLVRYGEALGAERLVEGIEHLGRRRSVVSSGVLEPRLHRRTAGHC